LVRDALLYGESSSWSAGTIPACDIDIEIFGISPEKLREILSRHGAPQARGVSFGVLALRGTQVEVSMPRRERAIGAGHKDFDVSVDPHLSLEQASARRDFTINAIMRDVLTGEIFDPWHGRADLAKRTLRHVRAETFTEDPLRVFRAAQFSARFEFVVAPDTIGLCAGMDVSSLPGERVWMELSKALMLSRRPSQFFEALLEMRQLSRFFPELERTRGVKQDPLFHPEGDVWNHTLGVLDEAAKLAPRADKPLYFLLAALCHDLGKPDSTAVDPRNGRVRSIGHELAGVDIARRQLERLTRQKDLISYVVNMVELHMRPNQLARSRSKERKTHMLYDECICPNDLILLSRADVLCTSQASSADELEAFLVERLHAYRERAAQPPATGDDLIAAGFQPGAGFSDLLKRARRLHFSGLSKELAIQQLISEARHGKAIAPQADQRSPPIC
jgi:tRNA nucleotidyltransferase (CCA-adding enzyme)